MVLIANGFLQEFGNNLLFKNLLSARVLGCCLHSQFGPCRARNLSKYYHEPPFAITMFRVQL